MRIKILTTHPLPELKAWFTYDSREVISTVSDLKNAISSQFKLLRGYTLDFFLDDFEILDDSPIDVVRDGDLICVRNQAARNKRKDLERDSEPPSKRARHSSPHAKPSVNGSRAPAVKPKVLTTSSSSEDESSDSESETSDSSSEDSSSSDSSSASSDSDSDSSSSSSAPRPQPITKQPSTSKSAATSASHNIHPAPPGYGKPTTHARNIRRRRKRQHTRDSTGMPNPLPAGSSSTNAIPLGPGSTHSDPEPTPVPEKDAADERITMASLRNKNKKRGYKNAMSNALPQKIVFSSDHVEPAPARDVPHSAEADAHLEQAHRATADYPRLIPPSEKQDAGQLPPNLFVTSIDVEEGMHGKKKKKKKRASQLASEPVYAEDEALYLEYGLHEDADQVMASGDVTTQRNPSGQLPLESLADGSLPNFDVVETRWESYINITDISQLRPRGLVGWKALAINPRTFTPEMLLNLAHVVSVDAASGDVVVQPYARPGAAQISFGGILETEEEMEHETHTWTDINGSGWRVVTL
ncbi:hypothetical protein PLICRDRAFT_170702 [Plicaturopsis crispa FD-325 SS-3]|nr:hypothetical protein PLICRDRAFT_170702 [Plicaturopsis crispa FD-325 SS-3]